MKKLIDKFDSELMFSSMTYLNATKCAELSKQIAVDFIDWYFNNCQISNDLVYSLDEQLNLIKIGKVYELELIFNRFLETYEI